MMAHSFIDNNFGCFMANDEHIALLKQGVKVWNAWREANPDIHPDLANLSKAQLSGADLSGAHLSRANLSRAKLGKASLRLAHLIQADLSGADLSGANLGEAYLNEANLSGADLRDADLSRANLHRANLHRAILHRADLRRAYLNGANLSGADLSGARLFRANLGGVNLVDAILHRADLGAADLSEADLSGAELNGANLTAATLVETDFTNADLTGCLIYGVSAWRLKLERTKQQDLVITPGDEPEITVDNIEVAQFIFLMLNNQKVRDVIDTITSKAVLILGRFTGERKAVLDALREELRKRNYLPILFDFDKPTNQTTDETITLLARMSRFVIADISDAKSVLQELRGVVPDLPSVPVQPIILATQEEPGMFDFYRNRPSFLKAHRYANQEQLLTDLGEKVIRPAELKVEELKIGRSS
jgi:uncharacterized protein YjbI with pentapeptide repeats